MPMNLRMMTNVSMMMVMMTVMKMLMMVMMVMVVVMIMMLMAVAVTMSMTLILMTAMFFDVVVGDDDDGDDAVVDDDDDDVFDDDGHGDGNESYLPSFHLLIRQPPQAQRPPVERPRSSSVLGHPIPKLLNPTLNPKLKAQVF